MVDESVSLGWKVLRPIPMDDSDRRYEAVLAVHSLVWETWRLQEEVKRLSD
jgi:hypothetical protein